MSAWTCALLIALAGAMGGVVNALLTDNGFPLPRRVYNVWCPGFIANILVGAFAALASWAFYGSGAAIDLAQPGDRTQLSLRLTALAGAFLVGVAGAKWLTNEADKQLLKESVKEVSRKQIPHEVCERLVNAPARQILMAVEEA